jgi:hypothetical protein
MTRLNQAIGQARDTLGAHAAHLPEGALGGLDDLLADFARRRVRIALYGEVKAGKSTLLNAIAGAMLSPVAFEPLTAVPVRVTYGVDTAWRVGDRWLDDVTQVEHLMKESHRGVDEVVVETNLDLLQLGGQVDLLDTPGVGSEQEFDEVTAVTLRSLDAVVLVVRYPALYTQFTRRLMNELQNEIGKLFVVWNLDASCAELSSDDRQRHSQELRQRVVGARELFVVDARAALQAASNGNLRARSQTGLDSFTAALARFATSKGRGWTALREAAKRAHAQLSGASRCLEERRDTVAAAVTEGRQQVQKVETERDAALASARARHADFESAVARIAREGTTGAARLATEARRQLRAARRRWIWTGDAAKLGDAVESAVARYADRVEEANRSFWQALQSEAAAVDTAFDSPTRDRHEPRVGPLAPEDRSQLSTSGRFQPLRRWLWHGWYLPGLRAVDGPAIREELASQAAWLEAVAASARRAAREQLSARTSAITEHAAQEIAEIRRRTRLTANEEELAHLERDIPAVAAHLQTTTELATEAKDGAARPDDAK